MSSDSAPDPDEWDGEKFDWIGYMQYRPVYTQQFLNVVFDYHRHHSERWQLAHDAGTGPGVVLPQLSQVFAQVAASDSNGNNIAVAKQRMAVLKQESLAAHQRCAEFTFGVKMAEDMSWLSPGSVDLITIAMALHWIDAARTVTAASTSLAKGGTLAVWQHSNPLLIENEAADAVFTRIMEEAMKSLMPPSPHLAEAIRNFYAFTDNLSLPYDQWTDVRRLRWNLPADRRKIWALREVDKYLDGENGIGERDLVQEMQDLDMWSLQADLEWFIGFIDHIKPNLDTRVSCKDLYEELGRVLEKTGGKTKVSWAVVLVMATRK